MPECVRAQDKINLEVAPFRVALEPLRGNLKLLADSLAVRSPLEEWFLRCQTMFQKWDSTYTQYGLRGVPEFYDNPGRTFISIITRAISLREESLDPDPSFKIKTSESPQWRTNSPQELIDERWLALSNDLTDNYISGHLPQTSGERMHIEYCKKHDFVKIPPFFDLTEAQKTMFDSEKRLKDEFFRGILQRYPPLVDSGAASRDPGGEDVASQLSVPNGQTDNFQQNQNPLHPDDRVSNTSPGTVSHEEPATHRDDQSGRGNGDSKTLSEPAGEADQQGSIKEDDGSDAANSLEWDSMSDSMVSSSSEYDHDSDDEDTDCDGDDDLTVPEFERELDDIPREVYPNVIAIFLTHLLNSSDRHHRQALVARDFISCVAKRVGPWPPVTTAAPPEAVSAE